MSRSLSAVVTATVAASFALAPGAPAQAATNGAIAFASSRPPSIWWGIWTIEPDGTGGRFRTRGTTPAWSPDGRGIAYISLDEHVMIRTGDQVVDTGVPADGQDIFSAARLDWSPDGTKLAFGYKTEVWVMNTTAPYDPVQLTSYPCGDYSPAWSPDGSKIAFSQGCSVSAIWIMNADGTDMVQVPTPAEMSSVGNPDWSPDGTRFAVLAIGQGQETTGLWTMGVDGSDPTFLFENSCFGCGSPDWSPDGTQIVTGDLGVANADGSGSTVIHVPEGAYDAQWRASP